MKKRPMPAWASCLLIIVLTIFLSRTLWLPITDESGETSMQVLEKAHANRIHIILDFSYVTDYRIPRNDRTEALLDEAAIDRTYEVTARYHSSGKSKNRYYEVLALTSEDGTVYRTIEESEANRQAALPRRIVLLIVLNMACCALFIWREQQARKRNAKEATP